jgi:hypothetical protein
VNTVFKILAALLLFVVIIAGYNYITTPHTAMDCLKLGSNERSGACLELLQGMTPTPAFFSDINNIKLSDTKMDGNTYYNPNPTFTGVITNKSDKTAKDIMLKFKFFKYNSTQDCNEDSADTVNLMGVTLLSPGDSKTVKMIVPTNFDTSGRFTYCASILGAAESQ